MVEETIDDLLKIYCTEVVKCEYCKEPIYTWQDRYMTEDNKKGLHCYCAGPAKAEEKELRG